LPGTSRILGAVTSGRYIALEGTEGCGKSTASKRLAAELNAVLTRETGGTRIGQLVRNIVADPASIELDDHAEALLIAGDRAQHMAEIVLPALQAGRHVVSDRSVYSSLAYQGYGRGLSVAEVRTVNDWAVRGRWPDLVIFLDVSPEVQAQRLKHRDLDRFEQSGDDFYGRVLEGFRTMAAEDPARWVTVNADGTPAAVHADIMVVVRERLGL
jgi:dTMP kinase